MCDIAQFRYWFLSFLKRIIIAVSKPILGSLRILEALILVCKLEIDTARS
jgi:hypothetical protein